MLRPTNLSILLLTLLAAALPARLGAQPIITGLPTNKAAFLGSGNANVTFGVTAVSADNGNLSYQWGIALGNGSFSTLTNSATYSGAITPNLTVNNTDLTLNNSGSGTKYKCQITEGSATVSTFGATLNVYNTPTVTPSLTITPSSIAANSTANITLTVSGLVAGDQVRVQRFLDVQDTGSEQVGDPLVQSFFVTDGQVTAFGGVTDPYTPGDDDGTQNGNITTHINVNTSNEVGRIAANYVVKISSPTGEFIAITKNLTITQPSYGPSVSGQVINNGTSSPVAFAPVALLQQSGNDTEFIAGTYTNATGNYTLNAPLGSNYSLLAFANGYVSPFSVAPSVTLTNSTPVTGKNIGVTSATAMITGKAQDSVSNNNISSVQFFIQGNTSQSIVTALSDSNGAFAIPVIADTWSMDISDSSLPPLGYLRPQNKTNADTTGGNANVTVSLEPVNALVYGTLTSGSNPLAGVLMDASDNANFDESNTSNASGYYIIGVNGASGNGTSVFVGPDTSNGTQAVFAGLVPFSGNNFQIFPNTATEANFTTATVTSYLNGTVTDISNSTILANTPVQAEYSNNSTFVQLQTTTDSSGNFSFGVYNGTWNIQLDTGNDNSPTTLVSESLNENVTGPNITGISLQVLNGNNTITGNVVDTNDSPVTNNNIVASATISGNVYTSYVNTDSNGNYTLPIVNGNNTVPLSWTIDANNGETIYNNITVVTNNSSSVPITNVNFTPSPFLVWANTYFSNNQGNSGPLNTPAGDGIPNLVKFAFNLNPLTNQRANLPQAAISNGKLTLVFNELEPDVTYTVQSSTDLVTWITNDPSLSVMTSGSQVTATYNLTGHPTAFLRILVTLNY